jgi:hypothetical protein
VRVLCIWSHHIYIVLPICNDACAQIASLCKGVLLALSYMHERNYGISA